MKRHNQYLSLYDISPSITSRFKGVDLLDPTQRTIDVLHGKQLKNNLKRATLY